MKKIQGAIEVNTERCKGCGLCVEVCPTHILSIAERKVNTKGYPYVTQSKMEDCIGCGSCAIICPDACITVYKKKIL